MSQNDNDTRHMILNAADVLFSERGYASVRLKDIADVIGVKHAALYYYFPGGKEELYTAVMQYSFQRHRAGMTESIAQANADVRDQLLLRRVILPTELTGAPAAVPANDTLTLRVDVLIDGPVGDALAGYRTLVFYP